VKVITSIFGIIRTRLITRYFGANYLTDAFVMAWSIPSAIINLLIGTIYLSLIPELTRHFKDSDQTDLSYFWRLNNGIFIFSVLIILTLVIPSGHILNSVYQFQSIEQYNLTKILFIILTPTILLQLLLWSFNSFFSIKDKFIFPSSLQIIPIVLSIIGLIFHKYFSIFGLAVGISLGNLISLCIAFIYFNIKNKGFKYVRSFSFVWFYKQTRHLLPLVIYQATIQIVLIMDRAMASFLNEGDVSLLHYGLRLNELVFQGFILTTVITIYPKISKFVVEGRALQLSNQLQITVQKVLFIAIPITIILIFVSKDVIDILFRSENFTGKEIHITSQILTVYSIGLLIMGYNAVFQRLFIAMKWLKSLMLLGLLQVGLKYFLNLYFLQMFGVIGFPISTLITISIGSIYIIIVVLIYRSELLINSRWLKTIRSIIIGVGVYLLLIKINSFFMEYSLLSHIIAISAITSSVFYTLVYIVDRNEMKQIVSD
jgi:putative peptidoglycan lipid II flippase